MESALENSFEIIPFWITTPVNLDRKKSAIPFNFTIRDVFVNSQKKFSAILSNPSILSRCLSRGSFFKKYISYYCKLGEEHTSLLGSYHSLFMEFTKMDSMKRQKDMTLKDELSRLVGPWYATGEEWRNSFRGNEEAEQKWKQCPAVDVSGGESKSWCCKLYYIGTWNVRSMNQVKLEVVRQ